MDSRKKVNSVELSLGADGYRTAKINGQEVPFGDAVLVLGKLHGNFNPVTGFYGMHNVNLLPDNEITKTRNFRCSTCFKMTTLDISDIALNGDEQVDLTCGCRVRLARIRDRAKAGQIA